MGSLKNRGHKNAFPKIFHLGDRNTANILDGPIEETENIKEDLWKLFRKDFLRRATRGFPKWYKKKLLENVGGQNGIFILYDRNRCNSHFSFCSYCNSF